MNRFLNIALMVLFGVTMVPPDSYACNLNHHNASESALKQTAKSHSCCDENSAHEKDCCKDDCNSATCCSNVANNIIIPINAEFTYISFFQEQNNISPLNKPVSSGFRTIWLPPKIGFSLSV